MLYAFYLYLALSLLFLSQKEHFPNVMRNCGSTYNLQWCVALIGENLDANPDIVGFGVWYLRF